LSSFAVDQTETTTAPFEKSVIWIPEKRKDWEDSVSEMTAVCTSAALQRHPRTSSNNSKQKQQQQQQPFVAPLSREYIRD
jgi:hypothetical protein